MSQRAHVFANKVQLMQIILEKQPGKREKNVRNQTNGIENHHRIASFITVHNNFQPGLPNNPSVKPGSNRVHSFVHCTVHASWGAFRPFDRRALGRVARIAPSRPCPRQTLPSLNLIPYWLLSQIEVLWWHICKVLDEMPLCAACLQVDGKIVAHTQEAEAQGERYWCLVLSTGFDQDRVDLRCMGRGQVTPMLSTPTHLIS